MCQRSGGRRGRTPFSHFTPLLFVLQSLEGRSRPQAFLPRQPFSKKRRGGEKRMCNQPPRGVFPPPSDKRNTASASNQAAFQFPTPPPYLLPPFFCQGGKLSFARQHKKREKRERKFIYSRLLFSPLSRLNRAFLFWQQTFFCA